MWDILLVCIPFFTRKHMSVCEHLLGLKYNILIYLSGFLSMSPLSITAEKGHCLGEGERPNPKEGIWLGAL